MESVRRVRATQVDGAGLKESEKRVQVAAEALRNVDRRKSQFLVTLLHELHNPLSPIIDNLLILGRAPPGPKMPTKRRR